MSKTLVKPKKGDRVEFTDEAFGVYQPSNKKEAEIMTKGGTISHILCFIPLTDDNGKRTEGTYIVGIEGIPDAEFPLYMLKHSPTRVEHIVGTVLTKNWNDENWDNALECENCGQPVGAEQEVCPQCGEKQ